MFQQRAEGSVFKLEWDTEEVERNLSQAPENMHKAAGLAVYRAAVKILKDAQPLTPKDTGQLRRSRFATKPFLVGHGPIVVLGYGTDYAVMVHENTQFNYNPGTSRYLKKAMRRFDSGRGTQLIAKWAFENFELGRGLVITPNSEFPTRPKE